MTTKIGDLGEKFVSKWLQSQSYDILHHKWRCRWGEIDLIVKQQNSPTIAFVEVKTRGDYNWDCDGLEAVALEKQRKISQSAALFLARNVRYSDFYLRFDVAAVKYSKIQPNRQLSLLANSDFSNNKPNPHKLSNKIIISEINYGYQWQLVSYIENAFDYI